MLVYGGLIAAGVAYVLSFHPFVTVDGPLHLGTATVLRDWLMGHLGLVPHVLQLHLAPEPNLLAEFALALLLIPFGPGVAEHILLVAYVVALPLALLYAVRAARPLDGNRWTTDALAFMAFPLTFSDALLFGFYNFALSTVMFLVVAGYALRHREEINRRRAAVLTLLLVITFFTHIVGFAEAVLFVVCVLGTVALRQREVGRWSPRRVLAAAAVGVGGIAVVVGFLVLTHSSQVSHANRLVVLASAAALSWGIVSYGVWEILLCAVLAVVLWAVFILALRSRRPWPITAGDGALVFVVLSVVVLALAPERLSSGGSVVTERLAVFPVYGAVLWLAGGPVSRRSVLWLAAVASVVALGLGASRVHSLERLQQVANDVVATAPCVAPHSTFLQVTLARPLQTPGQATLAHPLRDRGIRVDPLTEESGRLAAWDNGIDLGTDAWHVPYYLFDYRQKDDPFRWLIAPNTSVEAIPPHVSPIGYQEHSGVPVDYILLMGRRHAPPAVLRAPAWRALQSTLRVDFRRVASSRDGWIEVWERLGTRAAAVGASRRMAAGAACGVAA
jgi:hypothetical protein